MTKTLVLVALLAAAFTVNAAEQKIGAPLDLEGLEARRQAVGEDLRLQLVVGGVVREIVLERVRAVRRVGILSYEIEVFEVTRDAIGFFAKPVPARGRWMRLAMRVDGRWYPVDLEQLTADMARVSMSYLNPKLAEIAPRTEIPVRLPDSITTWNFLVGAWDGRGGYAVGRAAVRSNRALRLSAGRSQAWSTAIPATFK